MAERSKDKRLRRALKQELCCACGTAGTDFNPVDPAHVRTFKVTQSDHPANIIPLCRHCHRLQHSEGWDSFLRSHPPVLQLLEHMGWEISLHPFQKGKLILSHPEVAHGYAAK